MQQRIERIKAATVRILVDGRASGSGFVVRPNGLVATCFHVVGRLTPQGQNAQGQTQLQVSFQPNISVEVPGRGVLTALVHPACQLPAGLQTALANDYALLQVQANDLPALPVAGLDAVGEGADVYLCGFPLGVSQPVAARGLLSTKWRAATYLAPGPARSAAWLDLTQNRGLSGGPVMAQRADAAEDVVVALASFGLTAYAVRAEQVGQMAAAFPANANLAGIDMRQFAILVAEALATNSVGFSGCVSAEYLGAALAGVE